MDMGHSAHHIHASQIHPIFQHLVRGFLCQGNQLLFWTVFKWCQINIMLYTKITLHNQELHQSSGQLQTFSSCPLHPHTSQTARVPGLILEAPPPPELKTLYHHPLLSPSQFLMQFANLPWILWA